MAPTFMGDDRGAGKEPGVRTQTDPRTKDGKGFTVMLVISAIAVFLVGIVGLINTF